MAESLTPSQFSALKGRQIVAQGKRVSAPPWVEVTSALTPLPRPVVFRSGETRSQGGGEGKRGVGVSSDPGELTPRPSVSSQLTYGPRPPESGGDESRQAFRGGRASVTQPTRAVVVRRDHFQNIPFRRKRYEPQF
jgi:hypothetical protein